MVRASIIVPTYNSEKYLSECLESILSQTYHDYECIVIDDYSNDSTISIIENFHKRDSRIKFYQKKVNSGVSDSRNLGIKKANGEYLFFVDSDDFLESNYVEKLLAEQENHKSSLIISNYKIIYDADKNKTFTHTNYVSQQKDYSLLLENGYLWNKIFLKSIILNNNLQMKNYKRREDLLFLAEYSFYVQDFHFISDSLYFYRKHNYSSSKKIDREIIDSFLVSKELYNLEIDNSMFKKKVIAEIHSSYAIYLLKLHKRKINDLFVELWELFENENRITYSDFALFSFKRKLWYIFFIIKFPILKKYYLQNKEEEL